jgi:DNA-binding LacI/PurR family transcriptional regulator
VARPARSQQRLTEGGSGQASPLHLPGAGPVEPLYRQIVRNLEAQIRQGALPRGSLVPSERQICKQYGVSPITARRALSELTRQGLIYRQAGIGSFVADPAASLRMSLVFVGFDADRWRTSAGSMGELVGGVSETAWRHDATLHLMRVDGPLDGTVLARLVEAPGWHGLLLRPAGNVQAEDVRPLDDAGIPYVLIRRYVSDATVNCVVPADEAGIRLAVSHLARLGHRRVALVSAFPEMVLTQERHRAYETAVVALGLEADPRLLRLADRYAPDAGYHATAQVLTLVPRPTAIIVDADMAPGVYQAATDLRLEIPADLAVVGYDEVPEARSLIPSLTCVRTSHYETGRVAAEALLELMTGGARQPRRLVIEPQLVVRASCGARPDGLSAVESRPRSLDFVPLGETER